MSGYRPQNGGNSSRNRAGTAVSRRLRSAGWNISPSRNRNIREGIYVKDVGGFISVLVDLSDHKSVSVEIGQTIRGWGIEAAVSHQDDHSKVTFNYR